ncbi:putative integral membrane protein [Rosellinia necatrix]|uniref:Putative integral membrane protein n=1 Tax=Rosellinia necatrix TaxID=77044 RepID=A0A1W2TTW3_ROSNE|nr:putative integral membrane protein [Rosellinia necatrix]
MDPAQTSASYFDIQAAMYTIPWLLTGISIAAALTRIYLPVKFSRSIDVDDWVMLAAVILQIVYQTFVTIDITKGAGKTMPITFTPDNLVDLLKWSWFSTPFAILVSITARLSIAIFLVRLFGIRTWYKWFMIIFTSMTLVIGIVNIVIVWFQAQPVEALWDFRIITPRWNPNIQQIFSSVLHGFLAASDLLFALFPVLFVWKLNTNVRRKIGLTLVLALSIITFGIALAKLILIIGSISTANDVLGDTADVFYIFSLLTLISGVEQNLVIIIGCAPKLRAITKVKVTFFASFGSELRSLLRIKTKTSTSALSDSAPKSYTYYDRSGYSDLEMQAPVLRFDKTNERDVSIARNNSSGSTERGLGDHDIYRTDNFTVADNRRPASQRDGI